MNDDITTALERGAKFYTALPAYLYEDKTKEEMTRLLVELIDALDNVEFSRTGTPLLDVLQESGIPSTRKLGILKLEGRYDLTKREKRVLRYLANDRNPAYIASSLGISKSTAKAHKYSIFKKLQIHSTEELIALLDQAGQSAGTTAPSDSSGAS